MTLAPAWSLSEDRTRLVMDLPTEPPVRFNFDADEVDHFIMNLAEMRSAMLPPSPIDADPDPGSIITVSTQGRWYVTPMPDQHGIALLLLVPGYRWIGMTLDSEMAQALSDTVLRCLDQSAPE